MTEEFEGRDLSGAVFWGVDLSRARLRDVDLTGVAISHARVVDVDIDAYIERVTINGVDVTDFVNEHDPWFPLRSVLRPPDAAQFGWSWAALDDAWSQAVARARALDEGRLHERVGGEWSFVEDRQAEPLVEHHHEVPHRLDEGPLATDPLVQAPPVERSGPGHGVRPRVVERRPRPAELRRFRGAQHGPQRKPRIMLVDEVGDVDPVDRHPLDVGVDVHVHDSRM